MIQIVFIRRKSRIDAHRLDIRVTLQNKRTARIRFRMSPTTRQAFDGVAIVELVRIA